MRQYLIHKEDNLLKDHEMQFTEEQLLIQDMARSFAQEQIKPKQPSGINIVLF